METPAAVRRRAAADDRISALPDEVLHTILIRLASAPAAARTSVISRRWRRVWNSMPELDFGGIPGSAMTATSSTAVADSVDAALERSSAPTLHRLTIDLTGSGERRAAIPAHRVAAWLGFASRCLAGALHILLPFPRSDAQRLRDRDELALPVCEGATEIAFNIWTDTFLRPPPAGSFAALNDLTVVGVHMNGGELGRMVSSAQCPRLLKLYIFSIQFVATADVSIRSESLECLEYRAIETAGRLEVTAPMLLNICVSRVGEAYIVAPKLEKVGWDGTYNPDSHQFAVVPRHLRSLSVMYSSFLGILISSMRLMQRFDTACELTVRLGILEENAGYLGFLLDLDNNKLPACETLIIRIFKNNHALAPLMLPILKRCSCIRKLELFFDWRTPSEMTPCIISSCPCLLPESYRLDGISFDSLEEIRISFFTGSADEEEFVKLLLSRCNIETLKRVDLTVPFASVSSEIMEVVQRIHSPNRKVQFNVLTRNVPELSAA